MTLSALYTKYAFGFDRVTSFFSLVMTLLDEFSYLINIVRKDEAGSGLITIKSSSDKNYRDLVPILTLFFFFILWFPFLIFF